MILRKILYQKDNTMLTNTDIVRAIHLYILSKQRDTPTQSESFCLQF